MSLSALVMAMLISSPKYCISLPENFGNYLNFAGVAISENFARYAYIDEKGNLINGKLKQKNRIDNGDTLVFHRKTYENGNVEDHQVCVITKKTANYWCGEPEREVMIEKGSLISYSTRIFNLVDKVVVGKTLLEKGCPRRR
jgi:hypothetical protein